MIQHNVGPLANAGARLRCRVEIDGDGWIDALSKADFTRICSLAEKDMDCCIPLEPFPVLLALVRWTAAPKEDWELGRSSLRELAAREPMLKF